MACENEVDLNAPKKDITAAYGILDISDSLHYIKVNKAFLNQQNARTYAKESYSDTYYDKISVRVQEKDENGDLNRGFELEDTLVDKEEGVFEHDEPQKLYYFKAKDLDPQARYQLRILIHEGKDNEKLVKGETRLVGKTTLTSHNAGSQFGNDLFFFSGGEYRKEELKWDPGENVAEQILTLRFHYQNIFSNGDTMNRSFDWEVGKESGKANSLKIDGERFYERVNTVLSPNPENLTERKMNRIDILYRGANQALKTYKTVAGPSASIVQNRPDYTNLDTAAVGIFASAGHYHFKGLSLSNTSMDELVQGDITGHLKFSY